MNFNIDNANNLFAPLSETPFSSVLFVGVGHRLKNDDSAGIYICERIKPTKLVNKLIVESGIEKFIGKINSLSPDILVLTDCTDFKMKPGYAELFSIDEVQDNTFNTHTISLSRISEFFKMEVFILGVQPQDVGFGEVLSPPVRESADTIVRIINSWPDKYLSSTSLP